MFCPDRPVKSFPFDLLCSLWGFLRVKVQAIVTVETYMDDRLTAGLTKILYLTDFFAANPLWFKGFGNNTQ